MHPDSTKLDIKKAVEELFDVNVEKVNTMNRPGKKKRQRTASYGRTRCHQTGYRNDSERADDRSHLRKAKPKEEGLMALKKHKPVTPSERFTILSNFEEITESRPCKQLIRPRKQRAGRNSYGRITVRHRGGGHKRKYRVIDFRRDKHQVPAKVATIEYDPNRSANICLLHYLDGEKRYILCPVGLQVGDRVMSGDRAEPTTGNAMPIGKIPLGMPVHNLELVAGRGGQMIRSAGTAGTLTARDETFTTVRMPSGELRLVHNACMATIGRVGNTKHEGISLGKAGRARWKGRRPTVRGVAMNPVDHPMGGGEGRTSGGSHPVSPWGQLAKGKRTRRKNKASSKFIVKRRVSKKKKK